MSDLFTTVRKKRCPPDPGDESTLTPKKLRTANLTPPSTATRHSTKPAVPDNLCRLQNIQTAVQQALSHALATCAVSPSIDTGIVYNVLNHISLTTYTGLTAQFDIDDLRRLCWVWEWDGKALPNKNDRPDDDENPFLEQKSKTQSKDWTRGSMGFVISPTTHFMRSAGKRVPAYGIGIEVEMDLDKDMSGGMAAVARWTAAGETRRTEFRRKLDRWMELQVDSKFIPNVPSSDLPQLAIASKPSSFTRVLASASPKGAFSPRVPTSPQRSPKKSPVEIPCGVAVPFPITPSSSRFADGSIASPKTPSSRRSHPDPAYSLLTPRTPSNSVASSGPSSIPCTPVHQRGPDATTVPQTPTSRREAIYERIRQRSLSMSPTKGKTPRKDASGGRLTKEQLMKMGQEEMRKRCLLGRLGGIAESVWMLFSTPTGSTSIPTCRKRRALPTSEVLLAIVKSSPVPISSAEAVESLTMLSKLCPFFLKQLNISGEEWLEMPANSESESSNAVKSTPPSPGPARRGKEESAEEVRTRSPRTVKKEVGGLRAVREIIRRELELQD